MKKTLKKIVHRQGLLVEKQRKKSEKVEIKAIKMVARAKQVRHEVDGIERRAKELLAAPLPRKTG